jgi:hypothetical protein
VYTYRREYQREPCTEWRAASTGGVHGCPPLPAGGRLRKASCPITATGVTAGGRLQKASGPITATGVTGPAWRVAGPQRDGASGAAACCMGGEVVTIRDGRANRPSAQLLLRSAGPPGPPPFWGARWRRFGAEGPGIFLFKAIARSGWSGML